MAARPTSLTLPLERPLLSWSSIHLLPLPGLACAAYRHDRLCVHHAVTGNAYVAIVLVSQRQCSVTVLLVTAATTLQRRLLGTVTISAGAALSLHTRLGRR